LATTRVRALDACAQLVNATASVRVGATGHRAPSPPTAGPATAPAIHLALGDDERRSVRRANVATSLIARSR